jgi:hypothetical protein
MADRPDKYASWAMFLFGALLVVKSLPGLMRFMLTGDTYFAGYKSIPLDLTGGDAVLMLSAHFAAGAYFCWLGAKRLTGKT